VDTLVTETGTHGLCDARPAVTFPTKECYLLVAMLISRADKGRRLSWPQWRNFATAGGLMNPRAWEFQSCEAKLRQRKSGKPNKTCRTERYVKSMDC